MKSTENHTDPVARIRRRRLIAVISLGVVAVLFAWVTWILYNWIRTFGDDPELFKEFIDGYGWKGRFIALGIQMLQVVISLIPGELVEIGLGYT